MKQYHELQRISVTMGRQVAGLGLLLTLLCAGPTRAAEPSGTPLTLHGEVEGAVAVLVPHLVRRQVVRTGDGSLNVWLLSDASFDAAVSLVAGALETRRALRASLYVDRRSYLESERAWLVDLAGDERPWRLRLSRHLAGSLVELEDVGEAADAPRWSPPFRPVPVLLSHGSVPR